MKKRLFWAIFALLMFLTYSVTKIMFSDFAFATHSARNSALTHGIFAIDFAAIIALIAFKDKIKVRAKKLIPTIVLTLFTISFIVVEFGISGEVSSFVPFISLENGAFLIFAVAVLAIRGNSFKIYFLVNEVCALLGFVISAALCFVQFQPALFGAISYAIASNILYRISCDREAPSEEETLLKFEESVKKTCDLL